MKKKTVSWVIEVGTAKVLYGPFKTSAEAAQWMEKQFSDSTNVVIKRVIAP